MTKLTENTIEQSLIDQLISQGYTYYNGTDISPTGNNPQRETFSSVILEDLFKASLKRLNPTLPASALAEAYQKVINLGTQDIMENNERFHNKLTNGVTVEFSIEGRSKGINVLLLDVVNPENNSFWVVNQLVVREHNNEKRFDVVIFINGLPLVFIELKSAADEKATLRRAFTQIQNYKNAVPSIFYYNSICIITDGIDAAASSLSAPFSRYLTWKAPLKDKVAALSEDAPLFQAAEAPLVYGGMTELQTLAKYMLNKDTLVKLIRYCTVFEQEEMKDEKTGLVSQLKVKKVAAYHQYYSVQKAVVQTLRATAKLPSSGFSQWEKDAGYQGVSSLSQGEKDAGYRGVSSFSQEEKDAYYSDESSFSLREKSIHYRGNYNFSGLVDKARALRRKQTPAEKILWEVLRNRQLLNLKFRRQHQIGDYIVDFYCNELKLIVELDGEYHFTEEQQKKDKKREAYLTSIGNKIIRFRNEEVDTNLEYILETISGLSPLGRDGREGTSFSPSGRDGREVLGLSPSGRDVREGSREGLGDRKIGVIWHTQGSGKSLSMVFYCGQIITHPQMGNPTIVMLTDRNDLDDQLFGTFGNCVSLLRQTPVQADSREHLKELLKVQGGGVIFTTIQKFAPTEGNVYETLSERTNIVVVADEAHRSQYGFTGHVVETDEGSEIRYGNAKYLRDALPNASYIGFTGTPIELDDKSTPAVFGNYIDVYDIKQAVDDGATVPISYESRLVKIKLDDRTTKALDDEINEIADATEEQIERAKKRTTTIDSVVGHPDRIKDIAKDIVMHFEARQNVFEGKAMIVGMTRKICVMLYNAIIELRPEWDSKDLSKGGIKIVMTSSSDDPESFQPHHTTKQQRKELAIRMKDTTDELKLVIVRDMWLTGFDAPSLHTMYIDKKMQGHNLMQAIARVNRVYKDKPGGLIVDYIGIGQDLRNAMATYLQSGGEGSPIVDINEAIAGMQEKHEVVEQMFNGFDYRRYFNSDTAQKLQVLLAAQNFILANDNLKERFLKEVTLLSRLYAMSIPSPHAETIKDEVAFFQAVKARISKFSGTGGKSDFEVETAIKQIIDDALSSEGVIDIFEAAGIKAPSVSILSDEFLLEVKNMQEKNVAFELLKKLLNDEVRIRKTKNIAQGKKFSEMLEAVVKRYHNNQIDSAQVLAELTKIAKEMRLEDHKAVDLGLTPEEYAFYSVLNENESTRFLNDDKMKELIHTIVDIIRKNATVDWNRRDDVRARLRLTVKKILQRYGYPPDLARMEADRVLQQSESLAGVLAGE